MIWFAIIGIVVGALGSMLGIGGGVLLIPLLTGVFGLPIKTAIGASTICVIASSTAASSVYVGKGLAHTRLAMVLEIATTLGALAGGITAVLLAPRLLSALFAVVLLYVFYTFTRNQNQEMNPAPTGLLDTTYIDPLSKKSVHYGVKNMRAGMAASFLAGNVAGLLGIGGGIVKVPVMAMIMAIPMRAAVATSNFTIGITAATSGIIHYQNGNIDPMVAVPTALGILVGAQIGSRLGSRLPGQRLRQIFRWVILIFAIQMVVKAVTG